VEIYLAMDIIFGILPMLTVAEINPTKIMLKRIPYAKNSYITADSMYFTV